MKRLAFTTFIALVASISGSAQAPTPKPPARQWEPKAVVLKIDTKLTCEEARKKIAAGAFASPLEEQILALQIHMCENHEWNTAHREDLRMTTVTIDADGKLVFSTRTLQGMVNSLFGK